ncbi:hypothetical protein [Enterococcus ratti]|uniref:Uncharacterized protein n=2 Tax=Enterococcus ratti TaxID=150033 RepID=A0A1L8WQG1_9ENTE|nr:hypothetical protein [Enterococcus ratti]OJG83258.1 hypothetical protein RV14_GL001616 [Enterococcus ratti]
MLAGVKKQILIYGLKSSRDKFILSYSEEKLTSNNYIDCYNNEIKKAIDCAAKNLSTAEKWKDFTNNLLNYLSSPVSNFPLWKNYLQCLQKKEKNRLENIYRDVHILKSGENYFFEKNGEVIKPILHAKRGCKIGIDVARLDPNVELFFVLDEINMRDVVHKNDFHGRSITNRELRYVYRHRFSLENKITFF